MSCLMLWNCWEGASRIDTRGCILDICNTERWGDKLEPHRIQIRRNVQRVRVMLR